MANNSVSPLDECNVFVKYLPSDLSDQDFYKLFSPFGEIISSKIMVDQSTGKSLGYGFVRFKHSKEAHTSISSMNGQRIANKRLLCKLANQSPASHYNNTLIANNPILSLQAPSTNLYVKPLLPTTTEEDIRRLFTRFGTISDCKVMVDRNTGQSRQIGFVRFEQHEASQRAINEMNGYKMEPNAPPLTVKFADTDQQKEARKVLRSQQQVMLRGPMGGPMSGAPGVNVIPVSDGNPAWVSMWYPGGMVSGMNMVPPGMGGVMMMPGQHPYGSMPYYMPNGNGAVNPMGAPVAGQEGQAPGAQANQSPLPPPGTGAQGANEYQQGMMMPNFNFGSNGYPYPASSFPFEQSFSLQTQPKK